MRLELLRLEHKTKANFLYDLCDVSAISVGGQPFYEEVRNLYRISAMDPEQREKVNMRSRHVFKADDPEESMRAARAMQALFPKGGVVING